MLMFIKAHLKEHYNFDYIQVFSRKRLLYNISKL